MLTPSKILVVRLGALGDLVHTVPAFAALRRAFPSAQIDWVVDVRYQAVLDLVQGLDRRIPLDTSRNWHELPAAVRRLRAMRHDLAIDFQGLVKSAALAHLSGAERVAGFGKGLLREKAAGAFYTERHVTMPGQHVVRKNLALAAALGGDASRIEFPLDVRSGVDVPGSPYALLNAGAAWPNKRWPPARFGQLAAWLRAHHRLESLVLWGPREQALAQQVVDASGGAARLAPATSIADVLTLARGARLAVSGDTGPLHLAAAVGTPIVGLYGPTSPARNGPWRPEDASVSRFDGCVCHHERRCRRSLACIEGITVAEVQAAVEARLRSAGWLTGTA